jgi:hypothetical protein
MAKLHATSRHEIKVFTFDSKRRRCRWWDKSGGSLVTSSVGDGLTFLFGRYYPIRGGTL